jgi:hypothetical protein
MSAEEINEQNAEAAIDQQIDATVEDVIEDPEDQTVEAPTFSERDIDEELAREEGSAGYDYDDVETFSLEGEGEADEEDEEEPEERESYYDEDEEGAAVLNQDVLEMIETLHARLEDVEAVVRESEFELTDFAAKLDKIDDRIYLLQLEVERFDPDAASQTEQPAGSSRFSVPTDVKEGLTDAAHAAGELVKDVKPVVTELSETMNEIKDAFGITGSIKTPFSKRR